MKKQELIHLHSLLAQVQHHYEDSVEHEIQNEGYVGHGVRPTSIHKSKTDHKVAVFELAQALTADMEEESDEPLTLAAD
jgi:hypothetical protein